MIRTLPFSNLYPSSVRPSHGIFVETRLRHLLASGQVETRVVDRLDSAVRPEDMNISGFRFHPLTGDKKGTYAVTVTGNWRITFRFEGENALDVDLEDYH